MEHPNTMNESIFKLVINKHVTIFLSHFIESALEQKNSYSLIGVIKEVKDGFLLFEVDKNPFKKNHLININNIIGITFK